MEYKLLFSSIFSNIQRSNPLEGVNGSPNFSSWPFLEKSRVGLWVAMQWQQCSPKKHAPCPVCSTSRAVDGSVVRSTRGSSGQLDSLPVSLKALRLLYVLIENLSEGLL